MNQQDFTKPQGSQHNFQMIQDDGTHTGLSSRFEEEVAKVMGELKGPPVGPHREPPGPTQDPR